MVGSWCNRRYGKGAKLPNFNGPIIKPTRKIYDSIKTKPFLKDGSPNLRFPKNITRTTHGYAQTRVSHSGGLLTYGAPHKTPERKTPYPKHTTRMPVLKRERATCILQRKAGLPINMIAKFLGRSTSWIYRTLRLQILQGNLRAMDMRKLPGKTRILCSGQRWRKLMKLWSAWEAFLFGEEDKPP